ncbi:hypothetical protein GCM10027169_16030 [Gordonia jinhuaensis]|nr:lysozyme [Gordonia jinhuaensis]
MRSNNGRRSSVGRLRSSLIAGVALAFAAGLTSQVSGTAAADAVYCPGTPVVKGRIEQAFVSSGGVPAWGCPTNQETAIYRNGRFQAFSKDTAFYWNAGVDYGRAHQIGGAIRAKWAGYNWERGPLGYPTTNERADGKARMNWFEGGTIYWSASTGAHPIWGEIWKKWANAGGVGSSYGLPTSDERRVTPPNAPAFFVQDFEKGQIVWP